ncbi:CYTH domain-containing protein, partial [Halopseudomonas sp.]|uniref:CYTH domain-containing protein n=1 Tax=Halopseudomonas sp. TaxID=2901191 RepID=UPI0035642BDD
MAKETEIKLRTTPETLQALRTHPLLEVRRQGEWQSGPLLNQYFDTPARDLAGA